MKKVTACKFAKSSEPLQVDDVIYLPQGNSLHPRRERNRGVTIGRELWVQGIIGQQHGITVFFYLREAYTRYRMQHEGEPAWINRLYPREQAEMRKHHILTEGIDPFALCPVVPFTGMGYAVVSDGLIDATDRAFGLGRLHGIRQLGFLHNPVVHREKGRTISQLFGHTRFCHSLDVMAIGTLIGLNLGLDEKRLRTLRVGCVTHDAMTPAGGDTTKLVDREAFDEEKLYPRLFQDSRHNWLGLKRAYQLEEQPLIEMVHGQGLLGRILDIADKTAYVARDADHLLRRCELLEYRREARGQIQRLIRERPRICALWDAIVVEDDQLVFTDSERLADFLMLRALMFRELYYNPSSRALETLVSKVLIQYLYDTGALTQEQLLVMMDWELDLKLDKLVGRSFWVTSDMGDPRVETFQTTAEASAHEAELGSKVISFTEEFRRATKAGTHFLVRHKKRTRTFRDAFPAQAKTIEKVLSCKDPVRLYYLPIEALRLPPELEQRLVARKQIRK